MKKPKKPQQKPAKEGFSLSLAITMYLDRRVHIDGFHISNIFIVL